MLGLVLLVVPIICLHHAFYKIHVKISIKEVPVELKFAKHAVKNEISFSLCKYQPWYKNMNNRFES